LFQFHHQPFAYYTKYAPFLTAPTADYSASSNPPQLNPATTGPNAHLQDEQNFFANVASGDLPPVSFVEPIGKNNEHPGYADEVVIPIRLSTISRMHCASVATEINTTNDD
jgi:Phosphoesterase family